MKKVILIIALCLAVCFGIGAIILSLDCNPVPDDGPTTNSSCPTTLSTVPSPGPSAPGLTDIAKSIIEASADEYGWHENSISIILTSIPDIEMLNRIDSMDNNNYSIIMNDGLIYLLSIDDSTKEIISITRDINGESVIFYTN